MERNIKYVEAINEGFSQMMEKDKSVFIMGIGVNSPWYVGQSCAGFLEKFGKSRVIDTPVSENGMSGIATGSAIVGMRPVMIHPRMDFMLYAMDQIVNHAGAWHYMFGAKIKVPVTFRGIINRGGQQAAQHSQAFHAIFSHIPGLKVVMPSSPYDAKGLLISSIKDDNPVIYIDDRWLYENEGFVPQDMYSVEIGKGSICKEGNDVTVISVSYMVPEAIKAAEELEKEGIRSEVIDLRTVKPLDKDLIYKSVNKTKRVVIADVGWRSFGLASEVAAFISTKLSVSLKANPVCIGLPDTPAPASFTLEKEYFPDKDNIIEAVHRIL